MLCIHDTPISGPPGIGLSGINKEQAVSVAAEGMTFAGLVLKSKLEFMIAAQYVFHVVVGICIPVMRRTIDRADIKSGIFIQRNRRTDKSSECLFRLQESNQNSIRYNHNDP